MAEETEEQVQDTESAEQESTDTSQEQEQTFDAAYVEKLRKEAAKHRKDKQQYKEIADKYEKLKSALSGEDDADPQKTIETLKNENQTLKLRSKFSEVANRLEADTDLTFAYLKDKGKLDDVDPDELEDVILQALKDKPSLKNGKAVATGDTKKDKEDKTDLNSWIHAMAGKK